MAKNQVRNETLEMGAAAPEDFGERAKELAIVWVEQHK